MDSIPPLLDALLRAPGASGYEDAVHAIVRREVEAFGAEVSTDVLGSTVATVRGTGAGRTIAFFAHADQVGLVVRGAGDDGLLTVAKLAGWRPADAYGQRVRISTGSGEVRGFVVGPLEGELSWKVLRVDIGALDREHALSLVEPGDPIVLDGAPEALPSGRVLSAALDDRVGIFAGLEALRRVAADPPLWDVALVVSGQEETGTHGGARVAAEHVAPDVAIVLEVTYAGDAPGVEAWGDVTLGGGPAVFRGPVVNPLVGDGLRAVAAEAGIKVVLEAGQSTWSDGDDVFSVGAGVACGMVSIPLRYMHTSGEIAQLSDVEAASALVEAYARSLTAESSFLR